MFTTNVPAAQYQPLRHDLETILQRPVKLKMTPTALHSPKRDPAFRHYPTVLGLILGTGVGGGFVINGTVLRGKRDRR